MGRSGPGKYMDIKTDQLKVVNNIAKQRFEVHVGEEIAVIDYYLRGEELVFTHTGVPNALEGHGIGSLMARTALEHAKTENLAVVPECPFVRGYIKRHPEYQPLVSKHYRSRGV